MVAQSLAEKRAEARARAEEDFYFFCREVIGLKDVYEPLHRPLCDFLGGVEDAEERFSSVIIPRGHFKTTICSVAYPIWRLMRNPNLRILITAAVRKVALDILVEIKQNLEQNDRLKWIAPDVFFNEPDKQSPTWRQEEVTVRRTVHNKVPSIMVSSEDSSVTSKHFDLIIADDPVTDANYNTPQMRERSKVYRRQCQALFLPPSAHNRLGPRFLNVGTRWHYDDCHQEILDGADGQGPYGGKVRSILLGCYDEDGEPIFPTRFTVEDLEERAGVMGAQEFANNYLNDPTPSDSAIFKRMDLRWFTDLPKNRTYTYWTAVDPNRSVDTANDPCVVMTCAVDHEGHVWIVDISRSHPSGSELIDIIRSHVERWNPRTVMIETVSYQLQICQWLREDMLKRKMAYSLREIKRGPKQRKFDRICALQPLVEAHALHIREGMEVVAQELEHFPNWKNDDTLDTLSDIYSYSTRPRIVEEEKPTPKSPFLMKTLIEGMGAPSGPYANARRVAL